MSARNAIFMISDFKIFPESFQEMVKGTVMQIEKAQINDRLRVSKVS